MGWKTSIPPASDGVVIGRSYFYKLRTITEPDPNDPLKTIEIDQRQKWEMIQIEFRGMTQDIAHQVAEQKAHVYYNAYSSTEVFPIGGGGYNVVVNTEVRRSIWMTGNNPYN